MAEVLKAKREQTEKVIEEAKQVESVAERKARLLAQRDLLREHKKKQMAQELSDFNEKTKTKDNLYSELKKIDEGKQASESLDEVEKRRQILKGVKQQIEKEEAVQKQLSMSQKGGSILDDLQAFKVE